MTRRVRRLVGALVGTACALTLAVPAHAQPAAATPLRAVSRDRGHELTNLAHLDFLTDRVSPPQQARHTTYRLGAQPVGVLWVYAERQHDDSFVRVGGGQHDSATGTWGQGAYDADDIARAAVVYLRHWRASGDAHSRRQAFALLRGLTYLQTASGPDAGNVVLWMQPDGTLNPSPTPTETPDPSDSGPSYWLARTLWALGEGYAAFRHDDAGFAAFLRTRMDLAVAALQRQVLVNYGRYQLVDGVRTPAWLIVDGADASAEAVQGLAAYVRAGGDRSRTGAADMSPANASPARTALRQLARGIARLGAGSARQWPYGALLPGALSRSDWHAWGAQMPSALAAASAALPDRSLLAPAVADTAGFTPHLLTATGPVNGLLPTPADGAQIAYGADARVQALLAVGIATRSSGLLALAGLSAGWFFGQNPSGAPTYDRATGVTVDGVAADGTVNANSGAESTIHGLLTMEALDAHPELAAAARAGAHIVARDGQRVVEAEAAKRAGPVDVVTPASAWTGESQWSGGTYLRVRSGSQLTWTLPASETPRLVEPVVDRLPGRAGRSTFRSDGRRLGSVGYGGGGAQGVSAAPGALTPVTLPVAMPAGARVLTARTTGGAGSLDAVLLDPVVSRLVVQGGGRRSTLLVSRSGRPMSAEVTVSGPALALGYDRTGHLVTVRGIAAGTASVPVAAGGFSLVSGRT